ncbi:MAG TPA: hypothetical protein V6D23_12015, partial [Candidatus Obscuribacterales bacterium]
MSDSQTLYHQACQALGAGEYASAETLLLELLELPAPPSGRTGRFLPDLASFLSQVALGRYDQQEWNLNWQDLARFLLSQLAWEQGRP